MPRYLVLVCAALFTAPAVHAQAADSVRHVPAATLREAVAAAPGEQARSMYARCAGEARLPPDERAMPVRRLEMQPSKHLTTRSSPVAHSLRCVRNGGVKKPLFYRMVGVDLSQQSCTEQSHDDAQQAASGAARGRGG